MIYYDSLRGHFVFDVDSYHMPHEGRVHQIRYADQIKILEVKASFFYSNKVHEVKHQRIVQLLYG